MALPDWIGTFIEPLDRLGIVYMVTGSVGAMAYGEPRMTTDVDIILRLAPGQGARVPVHLVRHSTFSSLQAIWRLTSSWKSPGWLTSSS